MIFHVHQPNFPLNHFIESFIYFEGTNPAHTLERFLPDGNTEFIIDLTETPQYIHHNQTLQIIQTCQQAWVSGVRTRPITIPSGKQRKMMVIAFKKGKAYPFYNFPINELTDSVISADLVFGKSVIHLREKLQATKTTVQKFNLLEKFLLQQSQDKITLEPNCIQYAITKFVQQPTLLNYQNISEQIGYSQKHFIQLFKMQVGVAPKQYLRILRFQKLIQDIEYASRLNWSWFAHLNGFYDQAHLIHDFKAFSGFTPNEYVFKKSDTLNYVPVA
jgi:AraC-like DNA-binding protein